MESGEKAFKNPKPSSLKLQTSFNRKQFIFHLCSLSACLLSHSSSWQMWNNMGYHSGKVSVLVEKWRGVTVVIHHLPHSNIFSV